MLNSVGVGAVERACIDKLAASVTADSVALVGVGVGMHERLEGVGAQERSQRDVGAESLPASAAEGTSPMAASNEMRAAAGGNGELQREPLCADFGEAFGAGVGQCRLPGVGGPSGGGISLETGVLTRSSSRRVPREASLNRAFTLALEQMASEPSSDRGAAALALASLASCNSETSSLSEAYCEPTDSFEGVELTDGGVGSGLSTGAGEGAKWSAGDTGILTCGNSGGSCGRSARTNGRFMGGGASDAGVFGREGV